MSGTLCYLKVGAPSQSKTNQSFAFAILRNYAYTVIVEAKGVIIMSITSHKIFVQKRNLISLPRDIREKLNIKEGDVLDVRMDENKIIIEPMKLIPSSQAYFWSETAQNDLLEAKNDVDSGKVREFNTISEFLEGIKQ